MKKFITLFSTLLMLISMNPVLAQVEKIKFDKEVYKLNSSTQNPYEYFLKDETPDNWHSKITLSNHPELTNETEAAAEYAHKVQQQTPGASVLVLPDVAMVEYITFPTTRDYYEYNALIYKPAATKGLDMFKFAKRFYANEHEGTEGARKAAIKFAQDNSKKYMEMLDKTAPQYKVD